VIRRDEFAAKTIQRTRNADHILENNLPIVGGVFGLDQREPLFTALLYTTLAAFRGIACVEPTI
jgi:hypothetical protein